MATEGVSKAGAQYHLLRSNRNIQEYSDRNVREIFVGAFAGKDEIRAEVIYQEKKFIVEDYYRNAWLGIESSREQNREWSSQRSSSEII